jgi:hypothetical protein
MGAPEPLLELIRRQSEGPVPPAVLALAQEIRLRCAEAVQAVLFYGSCLRTGDDRGGMVDLYVIVENYRRAYGGGWMASFNKLMPPNVFYLEVPFEGRMVRAKYAVLSMADLIRGTSPSWFHSYFWGRFAQPTAIAYARSPRVAAQVRAGLAQAVLTFLGRALPCVPAAFSARQLWLRGLSLSYRAELRPERPGKMAALLDGAADYFERLTEAALPALAWEVGRATPAGRFHSRIPDGVRRSCRLGWVVRALQGKVLSVLRLLKGAFTFAGGLEYILWKIERHTGVRVEAPPRLRHRPVLAVCVLAWRLYRKGAFR